MSSLRLGTIVSDLSSNKTAPSSSYIALDLLFHISSFSKVLAAADVLDIIGSPVEKAAFTELKNLIVLMINSNQHDLIDVQPFLEKLSAWTLVDYCKVDQNDVLSVWDDIVKLVMVVIPPLREVFLGQVSSALEVPGWVNLMSRCFHADFTESVTTLEEVYLKSLTSIPSTPPKAAVQAEGPERAVTVVSNAATAMDKMRIANAMVLRRAPEILVVSIESTLILPVTLSNSNSNQNSNSSSLASKGPQAVIFPETFDLAHYFHPNGNGSNNSNSHHNSTNAHEMSKIYDLSIVVALQGPQFDTLQPYFRILGDQSEEHWYKGAGFVFEEVPKSRVVEGSFYNSVTARNVHPRLLVYARRDLPLVLDRTLHLVSKAGQMRALGDVAFALAMTTCENYGEARRCYEEAITLDEGLRTALQENLSSLEKIERTQRARVLEEQADLALANKRFREASELYSKGMMNAVVSSGVYLRVRDKLESVTHIIALDSACQFAEKGEEALKLGLLPNAKDLYSQAFKHNPEFLHLHTILVGIDKTVQMLTAGQRIADAQTAAKAYHYKLANHFYREAIALVPEKLSGLQSTLDSLAPLMQGEDALMRQKLGLAALDDKRYTTAIQLFTEAIGLLPHTQASCLEHAVFLCDRALAHYDLKDYNKAVEDCTTALLLKPELALAHYRLGAAHFGLDQFDLASSSYDRALKCDPSMSELIKVKVRQVTTAREIQQRKERETERAKAKEEEKKVLDEKRARDELAKKEKAEKMAIEQAEKTERVRLKEEEKRAKAARDRELEKEKLKEKEAEKEKLRLEKIERDALKAFEREKARLEKEKERERTRIEKEQKAINSRKIQDEEKQRQIDFIAELERGAARQREAEREKEVEKERARLERERVIAEREKARKEKIELEAAKALAEVTKTPSAPGLGLTGIPASAQPSDASAIDADSSSSPRVDPKSDDFSSPKGTASNKKNTAAAASNGVSLRWPAPPTPTVRSGSASGKDDSNNTVGNGNLNANANVNANANGNMKGANSKVWTASKFSADTITRIPTVPLSSISPAKQKSAPPSTDSLADFPKLGESPSQALKASAEVSSDIQDPDATRSKVMYAKEDDGQELGWSVRKSSSPNKVREVPAASSSSLAASQLTASNDIFSSMAERPAMSTDYTFKPSERTIKAAEAKRFADSQQKAAAAAAAVAASSLTGAVKGDFDEFLSNSSASYISNFSSSIRFNPALPIDIAPNNGLFFSAPTPIGPGTQPHISSSSNFQDSNGLGSSFPNSFSGLGFSTSFLPSAGTSSNALSSGGTGVDRSMGIIGGMGSSSRENLRIQPLSNSLSDECDDDFTSAYFNNPLASLVGLDLDDATDPLLMAIGGLSVSPPDSPTTSRITSSISIPSSPLHSLPYAASSAANCYSPTTFPTPINGALYGAGTGFGYSSNGASPSSSSSFSPRGDPLPPAFQRTFSGDVSQGAGQGLSSSPFPSLSSFGGLRFNASSSTSNSNLSNAFSLNDTDGFYAPQVPGRGAGIAMNPPYGVGVGSLHQIYSPFQAQSSASIGGILGAGDRQLKPSQGIHTQNQFQSHPGYPGTISPPSSSPPLTASHSPGMSLVNSSSGVDANQDGIETDILPESAFTSVAWLRQHGMHMYRWAGNAAEWTEYAMHLPACVCPFFSFDPSSSSSSPLLAELQSCGCKIWIDKETLLGKEATFLVFLRGAAGQLSNTNMNNALDLLSNKMRLLLPQISSLSLSQSLSQNQSFGSIGSNRVNTPPPQSLGSIGSNPNIAGTMRPPPTAWGSGSTFSGMGTDSTTRPGFSHFGDEEDRSTISDEYYDPEDLAMSLSLIGDTPDGTDTDWPVAPAKKVFVNSSRRPEPLKLSASEGQGGGYVQRWLEIPRDSVGLVIGQGGKKIKDLCTLSGAKVQFRVNKTAEREGRPGLLELQGGLENVDQGLQLVWDLLHVLGKEYQEVPVQRLK
jgi:KH domain/Tetratricopeptide repeat